MIIKGQLLNIYSYSYLYTYIYTHTVYRVSFLPYTFKSYFQVFKNIYLFVCLFIYLWLRRVLVAAREIFRCGVRALHCGTQASL